MKIVVIGAGVGGLSSAAVLARAGFDVTVLEAHIYPGGCAGTFYHQGYRFDAGATLAAGFYPGGPMELLAEAAGIPAWPVQRDDTAMLVHLPDGEPFTVTGGDGRWQARRTRFGSAALRFFEWQEHTADDLWDFALRLPPWPPQNFAEAAQLGRAAAAWIGARPARLSPALALDAVRPVAAHLGSAHPALRQFVDGQLLISAQADSRRVNALYGASALDLARRGVAHLEGGVGTVSRLLAEAVNRNGGRVLYRQEAVRIETRSGEAQAVITKRGERYPADLIIANLTPWNLASLLGEAAPARLRRLHGQPADGWGAFMLYLGVPASALPASTPLHQQVILGEPLGEGNSAFISLSPAWDASRAPAGMRAVTISTHTDLQPWWALHASDPQGYEDRKALYTERLLHAAEAALPGLGARAGLALPGTPVTFQRFTRRSLGWVGGFPQTSLLRSWGQSIAPGIHLVGDSTFPGQSVPAVALGGLRLAANILASARIASSQAGMGRLIPNRPIPPIHETNRSSP